MRKIPANKYNVLALLARADSLLTRREVATNLGRAGKCTDVTNLLEQLVDLGYAFKTWGEIFDKQGWGYGVTVEGAQWLQNKN